MKKFMYSIHCALIIFAAAAALGSCSKDGEIPAYAVTITDDGNGSAAATVDGTAVTTADVGATVTITATPDANCIFKQWVAVSGTLPDFVTGSETASSATFIMPDGNVNLKAEFDRESYRVMVSAGSNGTATATIGINPVMTAEVGETVTLTATPNANYIFRQWVAISGTLPDFVTGSATASPAAFIMPAAEVDVRAEFESARYAITMSHDNNGTAMATVGDSEATTAEFGKTVTIAATPKANYMFRQWVVQSGDVTLSSTTANPATFAMPGADVNIKAEFITPSATSATINGVTWAACNVEAPGTFAAKAESYGRFFQWNNKKDWPATGNVTGWGTSTPAGSSWLAINDPCPSGWRVPTREQQATLLVAGKVTNAWVTLNGVNGRRFTDNTSGATIFLPIAGFRYNHNGSLDGVGENGDYWSMTPYSPYHAWELYVNDTYVGQSMSNNLLGFSVRCVRP